MSSRTAVLSSLDVEKSIKFHDRECGLGYRQGNSCLS